MTHPLSALQAPGLDLLHAFSPEALQGLPWAQRQGLPAQGTGWLVGNTRALWEPWLAVMRQQPWRQQQPDPLDQWVEEVVGAQVAQLPGARVFWAHRLEPEPVPMQQIAALSGLAALSPAMLCAHPLYGPWFGLRALVISPEPHASPCAPRTEPCASCPGMCAQALERAMQACGEVTRRSVREHWERWVEIRAVCPVGASFAYSPAQLRYHYLQDRAVFSEGS